MDPVIWQPVLSAKAIQHTGEPGLGLRVKLQCRICKNVEKIELHGVIRPEEVFAGKPVKRYQEDSWFGCLKNTLREIRECTECGIVSTMPEKLCDRLIAEADGAITREWLKEGVDLLLLEPEADKSNETDDERMQANYGLYYSSPDGYAASHEGEIHKFELED